jgi:archaemetzincin
MGGSEHLSEGKPERLIVEVVPLGRVDAVACEVAAANIQTMLGLSAQRVSSWPTPEYSHLPARNQYDAGRILKALARDLEPPTLRLGIIALDLCLPILTYVYGEARIGGHNALVSLYRLGFDVQGNRVPQTLLFQRLAKVAVHETAHSLGLEHCYTPLCLMHFSQGLRHLDALNLEFCSECLAVLRRERVRLLRFEGIPLSGQ